MDAEQRSHALRALHDVSASVTASLDLAETLESVAAAIVAGLGFEVAVVNLVVGDGELEVVAVAGGTDQQLTLLGSRQTMADWDQLLRLAEPWGTLRFVHHDAMLATDSALNMLVPDLPVTDDPDSWHPYDALFAPLCGPDGVLLGILSVDLPSDQRVPGAVQRELLELFAAQAATAIGNARMHGQLVDRESQLSASLVLVRRSEEQFRVIFETSPVGMALFDEEGIYREVNDAYQKFLGRPAAEILGHTVLDFTFAPDVAETVAVSREVRAEPGAVRGVEKRYTYVDSSLRWGRLSLSAFGASDGRSWVLAQVEDVTESRRTREELNHLAHHDPLTGLPNRNVVLKAAAEALACASPDAPVSVLFIDVDRFKRVNDSFGHQVGDAVLRAIASRLTREIRTCDVAGRLGGDEFAVVTALPAAGAAALADRLRAALNRAVSFDGSPVSVSVSVGVTTIDCAGHDAEAAVAAADQAMYASKQVGGDRVTVFDDIVRQAMQSRRDTEAMLRDVLAGRGSVCVHYQPIMDLDTSRQVGAEALVRLVDAAGNLHYPDGFIDIAEETGLIVALGQRVLETACRHAAQQWRRTGMGIVLAVNVSAQQACRPDFTTTILRTLQDTGLPAQCLSLELTESALLHSGPAVVDHLQRLRAAGVELGVDDFGTGYASLTYLQQLPVTFVKVDRSFTAGLPHDPGASAIVNAVIGLAANLGLGCVVEGIERGEQLAALTGRGVLGQGFLFGRPSPTGMSASTGALPDLADWGVIAAAPTG